MNVVRDLTSEKYEGINEIVGTNSGIREEIARKVLDENPDGMDIEVKGVRLHLGRYASCSGKTIWYNTELTREQYIAITGNEDDVRIAENFFDVFEKNVDETINCIK